MDICCRLVSEAHRIRLAHLFDPVLAVHTSLVEPLPHQITAVYEVMLPRQPLRFLLADDPGAGKTGYRPRSRAPGGPALALCLLLLAGNAFAKTLGDIVIREERRVGANNTLFVGDYPGASYGSQAYIQFDDSGMISHLYTGTRCAWPNAAPDLSHLIVYDINQQNGCLIIVVLEDSKTTDGFEEGGQIGRRVEEDFAQRETAFEQQQGLIPRRSFSKAQIGLRAEFASKYRLLVRSCRTTAEDGKEFNTAVAYDFQTKVFSVPGAKEFERIKAVNFGEVGLERPDSDSAPTRLAAAPAAKSFPTTLGNIVIGEQRTRGPITLYTVTLPGRRLIRSSSSRITARRW
jgi:hypothetical protein